MVVGVEVAPERSARCGKAEEAATVLAARCRQLEADLKDCERLHTEAMPQVWMLQAQAALAKDEAARALRRLTLRNVDRVPQWAFARGDRETLQLVVMTEATRGAGIMLRTS